MPGSGAPHCRSACGIRCRARHSSCDLPVRPLCHRADGRVPNVSGPGRRAIKLSGKLSFGFGGAGLSIAFNAARMAHGGTCRPPTCCRNAETASPGRRAVLRRALRSQQLASGLSIPMHVLRYKDPHRPGRARTPHRRRRLYLAWVVPKTSSSHVRMAGGAASDAIGQAPAASEASGEESDPDLSPWQNLRTRHGHVAIAACGHHHQ